MPGFPRERVFGNKLAKDSDLHLTSRPTNRAN